MKSLFPKTLAILFFLFITTPSIGEVRVTDGDTIILQGQKIRLDEIDAPAKTNFANRIKSHGSVVRRQEKH